MALERTAFGAQLMSKGATLEQISAFTANPRINANGKIVSLFDLTEETDAVEAATILLRARL